MKELKELQTQNELDCWVRNNILAFTASRTMQQAVYRRRYEIIHKQVVTKKTISYDS